jgi:hypothetical protein
MRTGALVGVVVGLGLGTVALGGCSSEPTPPPEPPCVTLNDNCAPLFDPPTYTKIYAEIFKPNCATAGTCHAPPMPQAGLSFQDSAEAYALLLGTMGGRPRVLPNDPGCSILAKRLESKDPAYRMPPGGGLSDAQLCDVVKWLVAGAPNN